ncbi:MAG: hypothetical protein A2Y40_04885 [Candidatus Margulisbacteria bacterium GWF2_35_9]|nr:MAG: hypothetical protein A2Y40_04885 [Candidatus Margulisbacteria bacterium GWF2_35_9]
MKSKHLCPECSTVGIEVGKETINKLIKKRFKKFMEKKQDYFACMKHDCNVVYFCSDDRFEVDEIAIPVWFKDDSNHVPICYCYDIRRGDIKKAVDAGCKTIEDVRKFTKKKKAGKCKKMNPLGESCKDVFMDVIKEYS